MILDLINNLQIECQEHFKMASQEKRKELQARIKSEFDEKIK